MKMMAKKRVLVLFITEEDMAMWEGRGTRNERL